MSGVLDEYEESAAWVARRCLKGVVGDRLPNSISETAWKLVDDDDAFCKHVRAVADLLAMEEQPAKEFDRLLSIECAAVAEAEPCVAGTKADKIDQSKLALPNLFSPADISELVFCDLAEPRVPDIEQVMKAA